MRYVDEFRDFTLARTIVENINRIAARPLTLMEVCGTHTMAIARFGIRNLLPPNIRLISGPGCPVCVTPQAIIDCFIELGRAPNVILATFGDMIKVPGSRTTLEAERARGIDVRVVYSPLDSVIIARENPEKQVVFFGVGFETTIPAVALAVLEARELRLNNFSILSAHKLIPPAMMALACDPEVAIDGFICPGHVSAIIGSAAYEPITSKYGIPCVISGFEPLDILQSIFILTRQIIEGQAKVEVQYSRVVTREGNPAAIKCLRQVFEPDDSEWRGLGIITGSGLRLRHEFAEFDASRFVNNQILRPIENKACECGSILKGLKTPSKCQAFGNKCTPEHPLGPCMVSTEGACSAEYRYATR
ncbi:MAG: hydrogenase formation protein HypD [Armatimonadetes bacterium]|nr:hydrogenase formation protein HypD [Armatimonadota bacterium]